jgi:Antitoxin-like ribbon-helix-helix
MMLEVGRMVRTQIQLTEDEARALRRLAAEDSVSMSALVREAVDRLLAVRRGTPEAEVRRRAARVAGRFRSAHEDLSERHDDHAAAGFAK